MALQALWAPETQFQNKNGSLLVQGKIYVQYRGRSQLAKTYRDADGTYLNPNPLLTDNDGRVLCFADDAFSYTAVVCDFYGNELFSFDPIPCGSGSGSGSSSGSSAQHWIGINGQTQQISRNTYTRLKLPSGLDNVDYEGDFVLGTIKGSGTEMVLKDGLYLVNTVIRFKQSSDDLTNTLSNVIIHTRDFDTPNIQEVGAVVRDEAGPDASEEIHTITLTYIRHVSQDDVGSDRIKFAVETPNTWSECYIQNLQIAKLGSSVGGGGTASIYSPGDYISIENDTISVTGIEPENYATHDELLSATSAFITSADLPDLSSYATEQWVLDKHYITSADIPDIPDDLVTSAELAQTSGLIEQDIADLTSAVAESLADKMDKSSSADFYPRYDNPEGYLTSIPSEYVTESEMSGYVQGQTSGFITSADLPDVSDMATKTWVTEQHYITSADVPPQVEYSAGDNIDITNHVVSVTDTSLLLAGKNVSITPSGDNYVISAQVSGTSGYVTEQEMNDAIQSATSAFLTSADLPDLSDYATESYVQDAIESGTSAFLTSADLPDVSDMATKTWVGEQGYLTSIPSEYVTDTELESAISGKADTSAIPDVSNFVTQEDIDAAVSGKMDATESSAFYPMATNPSGYLVSSDLNGYATEQYVQGETSAFLTSADLPSEEEVQFEELDLSSFVDSAYVSSYVASQTSGKQDTLTFGYDASDKINAINGSAIAGGGGGGSYTAGEFIDITNDVISVDSGDVSNLIPGDGVLILQTSAGTQVELDVSAGPGVSLSVQDGTMVISRAKDELLWSGTSANSFTLSEPSMNFERLGIKLRSYQSPNYYSYCEALTNSAGFHFEFENTVPDATRSCQYAGYRYTTSDDLTYTFASGNRFYFGGGGTGTDSTSNLTGSSLKDAGYPVEIYGINRKVVGIGDN